jgi:hypothetical protein
VMTIRKKIFVIQQHVLVMMADDLIKVLCYCMLRKVNKEAFVFVNEGTILLHA